MYQSYFSNITGFGGGILIFILSDSDTTVMTFEK